MKSFDTDNKFKLSVIGLGYVGLPLAIAFAKKINVVGFDISKEKIDKYKYGLDVTKEVGNEEVKNTTAILTSDESKLRECRFHIIAVPTPINSDKTPNLTPVILASETLGRNLKKDSIVVYESTVYPGVTEEICVPILEKESGLKCGIDFKVGYSPERINPGDKIHRLEKIVKIVSGMDHESLDIIANTYELVIEAGVYRAESIKVAEAAKVIENSQRDINIAFMNELSIIFDKLNINTKAVLQAANTKWNFLDFKPGLVGGHCIGVDPYYLTYKAEQIGYHSQIILAGRKINDGMGKHVADETIKKMIKSKIQINGSKVAILGITFKENCPDVRNTKVIDIIDELKKYDIEIVVVDPVADKGDLLNGYGIETIDYSEIKDIDATIIAVAHDEFKKIDMSKLQKAYRNENKVLIDVKGFLEDSNIIEKYNYWRL